MGNRYGIIFFAVIIPALAGIFLILADGKKISSDNTASLVPSPSALLEISQSPEFISPTPLPQALATPKNPEPLITPTGTPETTPLATEIPSPSPTPIVFSQPIFDSSRAVNAIYLTGSSAGVTSRVDYLINLAKATEINAAVIDIKDFSGYIFYNTNVPEAKVYGAEGIKISNIGKLIQKLHDNKIYAIARIVVFQDPVLAKARPELAIKDQLKINTALPESGAQSLLWQDRNGLEWMDPNAKDVWKYNVSIAKDALLKGFDEVNFDYVRFPSDGDLGNMVFPIWDRITPRRAVLEGFFNYARKEMPSARLSVDFFGLSTIDSGDLGIGQVIEDAYKYFDYVSPMVYPSHYATGFQGFEIPDEHPFEVVKISLDSALKRLQIFNAKNGTEKNAKLRPWLQDFSLHGVVYTPDIVRSEITATKESLGDSFAGFMLWNPSNVYTQDALEAATPGEDGISIR